MTSIFISFKSDQFYIFFVGDVPFNRLHSTLLFYLLRPLTPLLDKDHTQRVTKVFIQCVSEDNAREGRMSTAENLGAGKRQRQALDQGKKVGVYQCTFKGSRPEQAHEIWPNCLYYNHDYWL